MIGLIAVTGSGRAAAARLAQAWPGQTRSYEGPTRRALTHAWAQCDGLVCFLAVGATVRLIAPLLDSKWTDPAVVCLDESGRHAVAVVGGHAAGANALAARVAEVFGAAPVITTATDAVSLPGFEMLGWPTEGATGAVSRALLDGEPVRLESDRTWPLPPLPDTVGTAGDWRIVVTDQFVEASPRTAVLRPPSLILGVEITGEVAVEEILGLADRSLAAAGLSAASVATLATTEAATADPAVRAAARQRGWSLIGIPAGVTSAASISADGRLSAGVPADGRPSAGVAAAGVAAGAGPGPAAGHAAGDQAVAIAPMSLAETAAMTGASELILPARAAGGVRVAAARVLPKGRLALIGTGPGARDLLTLRGIRELRRASVVAGLGQCLDQVSDLLRPGTHVIAEPAGDEQARVREAVRQARLGYAAAVAFPGGTDGRALTDLVTSLTGEDIEVLHVPGIPADPGDGRPCAPIDYSGLIPAAGQRSLAAGERSPAGAGASWVRPDCAAGG